MTDNRLALTINEFCERVGISRAHFYRLTAAGDIRIVKLGNKSLVPVSEIARLLGGNAPAAGTAGV